MTTSNEGTRLGSIVTDLVWWVCESPTRLRIVVYGSWPVAAFVLPLLSGSGIIAALKFASLQAGVLAASILIAQTLRHVLR
jgi:hypothetical protein